MTTRRAPTLTLPLATTAGLLLAATAMQHAEGKPDGETAMTPAAAKQALETSRAERQSMERRVSLLEPGSLDPDMLEERARLMLNYGHVDDIVILDNHKRRK